MAAQRPLSGRHAVVTGAGRGIGQAIAFELARLGGAITLMGRDGAALETHARLLRETHGVAAEPVVIDMSQHDAIAAAFDAARARLGPIAILVNNAGIAHAAPVQRMELAKWNELLAVDLTAPFVCVQQVVREMTAAAYGRIVNVASTAGLIGYRYATAYCAAKHGLVGLTRALAIELAKAGITVNAVCPGYTDTDMFSDALEQVAGKTGRTPEQAKAELLTYNPQGRLVAPAEVAEAVGWLCLPGSQSVTGQSIAIAGGEVM